MLGCQYETATFRGRGPGWHVPGPLDVRRQRRSGGRRPRRHATRRPDAPGATPDGRYRRGNRPTRASPAGRTPSRSTPLATPGEWPESEAALDTIDGFLPGRQRASRRRPEPGDRRRRRVRGEKAARPAAPVAASSGLHSPAQGTNTRGESPMKEALQFYINGEWVDPVTPKTMDVIDPSTEEAIGRISLGSAEDVDKGRSRRRRPPSSPSHRPAREERVELLGRIVAGYQARIGEDGGDDLHGDGRPGLARQGGAGALRPRPTSPAPSNVLKDYDFVENPRHDEHRQGTGRRLRPDHAVELADQPDRLQGRACARRGLHDGAQAERGGAAQRDPARRDPPRRRRSAGRLQPDQRRRPRGRRRAVGSPRDRHDVLHRLHARRSRGLPRPPPTRSSGWHRSSAGKSPNIVLEDADIDKAVKAGTRQCFLNSGQSCNAPTRMLVPAASHARALEVAKAAAEATAVGPPGQEGVAIGPVVSKVQYDKIQALIAKGVEEGAELVTGGTDRPEGHGQRLLRPPHRFRRRQQRHDDRPGGDLRPRALHPPLRDRGRSDPDRQRHARTASPATSSPATSTMLAASPPASAPATSTSTAAPADFGAPFGGYKQSGNGREWGRLRLRGVSWRSRP